MDKRFVAGALTAAALIGVGAIIIGDGTQAAPFQQQVTRRAAQAQVFQAQILRVPLADGGEDLSVTVFATVPETRTLRTALANALDNQFLVCARQADDLEQ